MSPLLQMLGAFTAPNVFNPWRDLDPLDLYTRAPEQRLSRLRAHFEVNPSYLLIGEAPGYQGCHFSGIPFTNEALLMEGRVPRIGKHYRITSRRLPWREPSATIMWGALHELGIADDVVMWNAFAWHPHQPGEIHTNRTPTADELKQSEPVLREVVRHFGGAKVIAVGNIAFKALSRCGISDVIKVPHPARGGANAFRLGMRQLVEATA